MEEQVKLEAMEIEKNGTEKMGVGEELNGVKSDSFVVDMARLSHITNKDLNANSKLNLLRSFSRKGLQQKSSETETNAIDQECKIAASAFPRAFLGGVSMLEKPIVAPSDRAQAHHQITIKTAINSAGCVESRSPARKPSFRRSQPVWAFDPRKLFVILASLSSMGTILLIFFTLSMSKPNGDDNAQNW